MTTPFRVLHVCTGNIGRSPMAERLMRLQLHQRLAEQAEAFHVTSAGTWGCTGSGMEEFAALALAERGGDPSGFVARELTEQILGEVDLVLTATTEHRSHVVRMRPALVRWTFTLKEFAQLAGPVLAAGPRPHGSFRERARTLADLAGRQRGSGGPIDPVDLDVVDPLGAPVAVYRQRAAEIDHACRQALALLLGSAH